LTSKQKKKAGPKAAPRAVRPRHRAATEQDLLTAVGRVLAEEGAAALSSSNIAQRANVDKALIYRYYGSLEGLLKAFAETELYWPTAAEVIPDRQELLALPVEERFVRILLRYAQALRARPDTLAILAGELSQRGEFQSALEGRREAFGQVLFELGADAPPGFDLAAVATLLTGAIHYLLIRGRQVAVFNGIALSTDAGWARLEQAIRYLVRGLDKA
jgi:AcrR family transcriptional regulator